MYKTDFSCGLLFFFFLLMIISTYYLRISYNLVGKPFLSAINSLQFKKNLTFSISISVCKDQPHLKIAGRFHQVKFILHIVEFDYNHFLTLSFLNLN